MSVSAGFSIYIGAWINWSRGPILGATITLTQRNGSLLTAFLGIFVTIAGGACWRILSFALHQYRAGHDSKNVLHHQQQVILRNSDSSTVTAWQMIRLAWQQRTAEKKHVLTNLAFVMLALSNTLLFAVAGVFSSAVVRAAGSETLISSSRCVYPNYHIWDKPDQNIAFITKLANDTRTAIMYARACYDDASNELQCGRFPQPRLTSTSEMNVSCPFQNQICLQGSSAAFQIRSGWIDTNNDLGINSKASDRLQYRKMTTCSVLHTEDYYDILNTTDSSGNSLRLVYYYYGHAALENYTFQYNPHDTLSARQGYILE